MPKALTIDRISKRFRLGGAGGPAGFANYRTLRDGLAGIATAPFRWMRGSRPGGPRKDDFWALRDVSFDVSVGEAIAVVGRNGAGKTTLLKVLSRIMRPTSGCALIRGRVGSMLEVGTSFHPELTGRENVYLNGAILGMTRREIRRKFDDIVGFAEVDRFLDTPVKRYSSGMFIRLAFAVAAHLEPEVLLIDEVLAMGDAAFQRKCLGKMERETGKGRTVLFVSHDMAAVQRVCSRAVWIDKGEVVRDGPVDDVIAEYLQTSFSPATERVWDDPREAPGNDVVRIHRARVRPAGGRSEDAISVRTPFLVELEFWVLKGGQALDLSLDVCNQQGLVAFRTSTFHEPDWHGRPFPSGLFRSVCEVPADLLNDGSHFVQLLVRRDEGMLVYQHDSLLTLEVRDDPSTRHASHGRWPGAVRPFLAWSTERCADLPAMAVDGAGAPTGR